MANKTQRFLYHLSNAVPLAAMAALAWYLQEKTWYVPVILLSVAICVAVIFLIYFSYGRQNCSVKTIKVTSISSKDSWLVAYVLTYFFPFASMAISEYNVAIVIVLIVFLAFVIERSIIAMPNMLLFFMGYHFYEVNTEESNGMGDFLLITKRKRIRNKADVKTVIRIFEILLIDIERDD